MTNSLEQMSQRREAWLSEKPQGGSGDLLRGLQDGDEIFFWFAANGDDGDKLIKIYRAHSIQTQTNRGPMNVTKYCLAQNDNQDCPYCQQGLTDMKERMGIWMYVTSILHARLAPNTPPEKIQAMPRIEYQGNWYFKEDINGFKLWDASAWRDSPWGDIKKLFEMYKGLHKFMAQMTVSGVQMQRRYKLYAIPNSPTFSAELYAQAQQLKPVTDYLKEQLATPIVVNPNAQPQTNSQQSGNAISFQPTTASPAPFSPFGNTAAPSAVPTTAPITAIPSETFNPFGNAPPAAAPTAEPTSATPPEQQQSAPETAATTLPWENNDEHKPLSGMF